MQEKTLALEHLGSYAVNLGAAFEPWLMQCLGLGLSSLSFRYSEDVREVSGGESAGFWADIRPL